MKTNYHIEGRQVPRRMYGGMYCTVRIFHKGEQIAYLPLEYGCDSYILQRAYEWLGEHGHPQLKECYENGYPKYARSQYLRDVLHSSYSIITVARKRDL